LKNDQIKKKRLHDEKMDSNSSPACVNQSLMLGKKKKGDWKFVYASNFVLKALILLNQLN
jgi:hypothetical protein